MESILKKTFDMDRFAEVVEISSQATRLWGEVLETCKNVPSPMNAFDGFILMAPIVTLRGRKEVVAFYEVLKKELEERVANGIAAVPGERYRLLWDNLPVWFKLRDLSDKFIDLKTCVAASTYLSGWVSYEFDVKKPLDSIARAYSSPFINASMENRARLLKGIVEQYSIDGIIFHSNRSCRPYSLGQYDIKELLTEWTGVPGLLIEGDMNDERTYAEGPVYNRIEAFIESLEPRKALAV
jgi:benzoyl-CoA reductase/2-hydroxyglutaryl-CoA dehydratase subunit BcrC/BadD/HgdB